MLVKYGRGILWFGFVDESLLRRGKNRQKGEETGRCYGFVAVKKGVAVHRVHRQNSLQIIQKDHSCSIKGNIKNKETHSKSGGTGA